MEDKVINVDMLDRLKKFVENFGEIDYQRATSLVEKAITQVERNVQMNLILINLSIELYELFKTAYNKLKQKSTLQWTEK
jgi:hypothetical protein